MIVVTGATGQLGRLVIDELLKIVPANRIIAAVRDPAKAMELSERGVKVRHADYNHPATLDDALHGAEKLLLISSSEVAGRVPQHRAAIDAAQRAGVKLIAYTSILHADTSPLGLAAEHKETEAALVTFGVPHVVLRNGWYTENYTGGISAALAHHSLLGCAGTGRIASATRAEYAAAAAAVLTREDQAGRIYELAGDESFDLSELAHEISRQSGKTVEYRNLSESDYRAALIQMGVPEGIAALLADSDTGASKGGLCDHSKQLSTLIGRPTERLPRAVEHALAALGE
jgi:NAD(P)H dehydrogenase (quinone)